MPGPQPAPLLVACLCAEWCGVCRDYRPVFDALRQQAPPGARHLWVDIDDDEEALGAVEVDDFPTLLVARGDRVLFFGVVAPTAAASARAVQRAVEPEASPVPASDGLRGLPQRLRALASRD